MISKIDIASKFISSYIFEPFVAELTDNLLSTSVGEKDMDIHQIEVQEQFYGKTYFECFVAFKMQFDLVLLGLARTNKVMINPNAIQLEPKDVFIFIGDFSGFSKLEDGANFSS